MKIKTLAIALALTTLPTLGLAMGCSGSKHEQAMSCGEGTSYDSEAGKCLPVTT